MLSVIYTKGCKQTQLRWPGVIMMSVIMLSAVAPFIMTANKMMLSIVKLRRMTQNDTQHFHCKGF